MGVLLFTRKLCSFPIQSTRNNFSTQLNLVWKQRRILIHRLCYSTQRAVITNFILLRHTGKFILNNFRDRYRTLYLKFLKDHRLIRTQTILLSGCFISFAQDRITDDEVVNTLKGFSIEPATDGSTRNVHNCTDDVKEECLDPSAPHTAYSWDPPLTLFVRRFREYLLDHIDEYIHPINITAVDDDDDLSSSPDFTDSNDVSNDVFPELMSSTVANLNIHSDGSGFVDETWDLLVDRPDIHIWSRSVKTSPDTLAEQNSSCKYEYRVCGQLRDVSALSFLEVQLNLAYRRCWDDRIIDLDIIPSNINQLADTFSVIRWVVRFPFPLANREYMYIRRWWLQTISDCITASSQKSLKHSVNTEMQSSSDDYYKLGRYAFVVSRTFNDNSQSVTMPNQNKTSNGNGNGTKKRTVSFKQNLVPVNEYHSEMLIKSHGEFDEMGLDYYLIYYDDPCLPILNNTAMNLLSGKSIDRFMTQLCQAAKKLDRHGLPDEIKPIVLNQKKQPKQLDSFLQTKQSTDKASGPDMAESTTVFSPTTPRVRGRSSTSPKDGTSCSKTKSRFFTDYPPQSNLNEQVTAVY